MTELLAVSDQYIIAGSILKGKYPFYLHDHVSCLSFNSRRGSRGGRWGLKTPPSGPACCISMYDRVKISKQTSAYPLCRVPTVLRVTPAYTDLAPLR